MTDDDVRQLVREECKRTSITAFARKAKVTRAYVYAVMSGGRRPGPSVLAALGLEAVTVYRPKKEEG